MNTKLAALAVALTFGSASLVAAQDGTPVAPVGSASSIASGVTFDGFYAGGTFSHVNSDFDKNCFPGDDCDEGWPPYYGVKSKSYGVRVGYDKRYGNFVIGAIADFDTLSDSQDSLKSLATLKLRGGYVLGETTLFYGSVGRANGKLGENWVVLDEEDVDLEEHSNSGKATVTGLGVEHYLQPNLSIFAEINRYSFDSIGHYTEHWVDGEDVPQEASFDQSGDSRQVKIGVNYRF
ncbi:outer membrane beta-barrel protein [Xinfangfangia sp. CPCC 101601]|uniref:Outer membrane beta-barrel protein n=1 Tax=Pseudogemmobacter lacusdianii TaxID=3069608 RepID=A0ABU0W1Y4_9RHOB|nr:outer membrane beta-barrel protein [Xinfangfangia sp. CPCC 101601]MDQ2067783.1 outer membrane beta-barrel protein [Xinfangfangia sp. CPCC 101601]